MSDTPTHTQPLTMKTLFHPLALAALALLGGPAHSDIVINPSSIVDHGSYISDTVNHLDWYKFSNAETTVGLSFTAANVVAGAGWTYSSLAQVQSLQAQFGWVTDTFDLSSGNFGLTAAMANYLGFTGVQSSHPISSPYLLTTVSQISAMTMNNDPSCGKDTFDCGLTTTYSAYSVFENTNTQISKIDGDQVDGTFSYTSAHVSNPNIGTWLSRASVEGNPDPNNVPEPGSFALVGLGLAGLIAKRKKIKTI